MMELNDAQNFAEHIAQLTHNNLSLEARIQISEKIERQDYTDKFEELFAKQAQLGYLESEDTNKMQKLTDDMLACIELMHGKKVRDTFYHAL